jgi:hypothetical protein
MYWIWQFPLAVSYFGRRNVLASRAVSNGELSTASSGAFSLAGHISTGAGADDAAPFSPLSTSDPLAFPFFFSLASELRILLVPFSV